MKQESISAKAHEAIAYFPLIEDFDDHPPVAEIVATVDDPDEDELDRSEPFAAPVPNAEEIAVLRDAAYAQGRRDERGAIATEQAVALEATLATMLRKLDDAGREASAVAEAAAEQISRLVLRVLGTMMPALCARHGGADVVALVRAVVPALLHEPSVTIRVSPHVHDAVRLELARAAPEWGERIKVVATDAMASGDARIAWENGTASRDVAELWAEIVARLTPLGLIDETAARPFAREMEHA